VGSNPAGMTPSPSVSPLRRPLAATAPGQLEEPLPQRRPGYLPQQGRLECLPQRRPKCLSRTARISRVCPLRLTVAATGPLPSDACLALHHQHRVYGSFADFQRDLPQLISQGRELEACAQLSRQLGCIEPLSDRHVPPEALQVQGPNFRESLLARGCLSRNRAMLLVLQRLYGDLERLQQQRVYLVEAVTGFALWLKQQLPQLTLSEFFDGGRAPEEQGAIPHQDLCALTFASGSFDLVLCNELFEHVYNLPQALREIGRVLQPGGRLLATFPMAFGQWESLVKARWDPSTGATHVIGEPDFHGDPIRPGEGSLVYQIPGWEVLDQAREAGFHTTLVHCVTSWKHGVLGGDISGVLVLEAQR
jgi:SAM-dependent methyltransferase